MDTTTYRPTDEVPHTTTDGEDRAFRILSGDWDQDGTTTVALPIEAAEALLQSRGWKIGEPGYRSPSGTNSWHLEEALKVAFLAEVATEQVAGIDYEIETWEEADAWKEKHASQTDHPLTTMLADALRQRGAIDPQTYTAIWGNTDYLYDQDLWAGLPLTAAEIQMLQQAAKAERA